MVRPPQRKPQPGETIAGCYSVLDAVERHHGVLKAPDLARILGLTRKTIYEMMSDGRIPTIQDGASAKRVDPKTYAFFLRSHDPVMRLANR